MLLVEFLRYMVAGMIGWVLVIGLFCVVLIFISGHKAWKMNRRK